MTDVNCRGNESYELRFEYKPTVDLKLVVGIMSFPDPTVEGSVPCIVCGSRILKGIAAYLNNGGDDVQMVGMYCQDHDDEEEIMKAIVLHGQNQHLGRADSISQLDINTLPVIRDFND